MTIAMTIIITGKIGAGIDDYYDDDHERLTFPCLYPTPLNPPPRTFFHRWGATLGRYLEDFFDCCPGIIWQTFPPKLEASGIQGKMR